MVFLPVRCLINCSWGHSSEDLNCFLYPQLPFITLAAGYFTLAGGLNLTGTAPKRFMLGGKTPTSQMDLNWWVKRQRLVLISALQKITQWAHRCPIHYSVWSRQVRLCQELASAPSSPGKWPLTCFELGVSCSCRALSCKKHTKEHLSRRCNGSDLEPELERRHLRCGLFGEQNRRLSSSIVASHKDSVTMDAADLCDNKSAGGKKEECVCAHCVQSGLLWIWLKRSLVYLH